ncbi:MAG: hypothetical protein H7125_08895 [Proteobacteria bacterium]|nr:hypothetical protein [Burkholderiales bacterium]
MSESGFSAKWQSALLFCILCLASGRMLLKRALTGDLWGVDSPFLYQAGTLGFNYFELGPIRRGLGGSIAHLLAGDMLVATVRFHFLAAACVAFAAALVYSRVAGPPSRRLAYAIVMIGIMLCWADDPGRTDMLVAALLAAAAVALQRGRADWAAAAIGGGLFVHETSLIFGLPLIVALIIARGGPTAFNRRVMRRAALLLLASLGGYFALGQMSTAPTQLMVDTVRDKFFPHKYVDWAIYYAVSGFRGVATSICQNRTHPSYWIHPFGGIVVLAVVYLATAWRFRSDPWVALLAALPPFLFLCLVANDTFRWTLFAAFNIWLVGASRATVAGRSDAFGWLAVAAAIAVVPLTHPRFGKDVMAIYAGSPLIERALHRFGVPRTPHLDQVLLTCDPDWRDVLGDNAGSDPPR